MAIDDCTALLRCPVCGADMEHDAHSLRCDRRHTFDIARQGYVDLLPAGHGRHTIEGDTREMIDARARVLEAALFEPLAACVAAIASASLARTAALRASTGDADTTSVILDCGCGTGYYLGRIADHAANAASRLCLLGTDISTAALRRAARAVPRGTFFRNDIGHRITVADRVVDLIVNIFAPRSANEFQRVLHPHGALLIVIPGADHLTQLRTSLPLLAIDPDKADRLMEALHPRFELVDTATVRYERNLDDTQLVDLLRMGPSARHLEDGAWQEARRLAPIDVTFDFLVLELRHAR